MVNGKTLTCVAFFCLMLLLLGGCRDKGTRSEADPEPPIITLQPTGQQVQEGQVAHFVVNADGSGTVSYQWQWLDGSTWTNISSATGPDYETPAASLADDGKQFRCEVSNEAGTTVSAVVSIAVTAWDGVWRVDGAASSGGDGRTWQTACATFQAALALAQDGDEIWVAAGTYYPGTVREDSFVLKPNLEVYGGFSGSEEKRLERSPSTNMTTLSGDLGIVADVADNAFHVVTGAAGAVLDGFTITAGNAEGAATEMGGGLLIDSSAGMLVSNCRFIANNAPQGAAVAINFSGGVNSIERCRFTDNVATLAGAGVANMNSPTVITDSLFQANAIDLSAASPLYGSAIYNWGSGSTALVTNCTFTDNVAPSNGGTIHNRGVASTLTNSILWGNTAPGGEVVNTNGGACAVSYSCVEGGHTGVGNVDSDPLFADPDAGDLSLQPCSPAIDAANGDEASDTDLWGQWRFDDTSVIDTGVGATSGTTWVDIGACERHEASGGPWACRMPASCLELLQVEPTTTSGLYSLDPEGTGSTVQTYCDMVTDGGGWTLVLLNSSYSVPPKPGWVDLVEANNVEGTIGGGLDGAFDMFLGVKYWNALGTSLRVEVGAASDSIDRRATYDFLLDSSSNYTINLSNENLLIGAERPGLYTYHNNRQLSSRDQDHDTYSSSCSSISNNTAWWYGNCWDGSFWGGGGIGGYDNAAYWTGNATSYNWGAMWVK